MNTLFPWACPVCFSPLAANKPSWKCSNHHCFDVAKSGYVNLLLANQKASKLPGDSMEMLTARSQFLQKGFFSPVVTAINTLLEAQHAQYPDGKVLDMGCGEGYYLDQLKQVWEEKLHFAGVDIAKNALHIAAKRQKSIQWACASNIRLPILDQSIDLALRIFAPSADKELHRVLKKGGRLIMVTPGSHHLYELKELIYDQVNTHTPPPIPDGFQLVEERQTQWEMSLDDPEDRLNLLKMTPFYWRTSDHCLKELSSSKGWVTQGHVRISVFSRLDEELEIAQAP